MRYLADSTALGIRIYFSIMIFRSFIRFTCNIHQVLVFKNFLFSHDKIDFEVIFILIDIFKKYEYFDKFSTLMRIYSKTGSISRTFQLKLTDFKLFFFSFKNTF